MIEVILSYIVGGALVLLVQRAYKAKKISSEATRKLVHIISGLLVISWPFFTSWHIVIAAEVFFLCATLLSRRLGFFSNLRHVGRTSWGEFFFSLGVIGAVLLGAPRWVFVVAMLHLIFADTAAALVGQRYGASTSYRILGQKKSLVGSAAFVIVSSLILLAAGLVAPNQFLAISTLRLSLVPILVAATENVGVYGLDNTLIPVAVVLLLR